MKELKKFEKYLPSDSNIIKFRKLFKICKYFEYDDGFGNAFGYLHITKENIKDAPTDTRLRKGIVEHILSGGIMQCGGGFRLI